MQSKKAWTAKQWGVYLNASKHPNGCINILNVLHVVINNAEALKIRSLNLYGININIFRHKTFMVTYFKSILLCVFIYHFQVGGCLKKWHVCLCLCYDSLQNLLRVSGHGSVDELTFISVQRKTRRQTENRQKEGQMD